MALSVTSICNMALARIGAKRINDYEADTSLEAIQCQTHYEPLRDALLRGHSWRFASARATLSADPTAPVFEWDYKYALPADCLRVEGLYDATSTYAVEGGWLLTNDDSADLWYIRRVTDPGQFDPLFAEVLVLQLALRLVMPLSQDKVVRRELQEELAALVARVRTVDRHETSLGYNTALTTWIDARTGVL